METMRQQWRYARGNLIMDGTNGLDRFADRNNAIPQELKERKQWVTWHYSGADQKSYNGSISDPSTWHRFEDVQHSEKIAFVITADDPYIGINLDDCIDDQGMISGHAKLVLQITRGYAETSPSLRGIKLITRAKMPKVTRHEDGGWLGCYDRNRFWCMTGKAIVSEIAHRTSYGEIHVYTFDKSSIEDDQSAVNHICNDYLYGYGTSYFAPEPSQRRSHKTPKPAMDRGSILIDTMPPSGIDKIHQATETLARHLWTIHDGNGVGISDDDVFGLLSQWNLRNPPPLHEDTIRQIMRSSRRLAEPQLLSSSTGPERTEPADEDQVSQASSAFVADWVQDYAREPSQWEKRIQETSGRKISRTVILDDIPIEAAQSQPHIVEDLWPIGMMMLVSGSFKTCKTTLSLMLCFDILTGGRFLDRFQVGQKPNTDPDDPSDGWRVLFMSCESGAATLRKRLEYLKDNLVQRMIDDGRIPEFDTQNGDFFSNLRVLQKRLEMRDYLQNHIGKMLKRLALCDEPQLITRDFIDDQTQQEHLRGLIARHKSDIVFLDPEYLQFDADRADGGKTGILYDAVRKVCASQGATLAIVAHNRAPSRENPQRDFVTLEDVAYSGLKQYARSWLLIARASDMRDGKHELLLTTGNSDGGNDRLFVELLETRSSLRLARVLTEPEWEAEKDQQKQERAKERELEANTERLVRLEIIKQIIAAEPMIARSKIKSLYRHNDKGIGDETLKSDLQVLMENKEIKCVNRNDREYYSPPGWIDPESAEGTGKNHVKPPKKPIRRRAKQAGR
jgi:hypothetical protein